MPIESRVKKIPRPTSDWTIVKLAYEHKTDGGIIIPKSAYDSTPSGEVMAVGPGRRNEVTGQRMPLDWKVGDTVLIWGGFVDLGKAPTEEKLIKEVPLIIEPGRQPTEDKQAAECRLVAVQEKHVLCVEESEVKAEAEHAA